MVIRVNGMQFADHGAMSLVLRQRGVAKVEIGRRRIIEKSEVDDMNQIAFFMPDNQLVPRKV